TTSLLRSARCSGPCDLFGCTRQSKSSQPIAMRWKRRNQPSSWNSPRPTRTRGAMPALPDHHVIVKFGAGIPVDERGKTLLQMERDLRQKTGLRVEVFQEARGDDSRLRALMTPEQRAKL